MNRITQSFCRDRLWQEEQVIEFWNRTGSEGKSKNFWKDFSFGFVRWGQAASADVFVLFEGSPALLRRSLAQWTAIKSKTQSFSNFLPKNRARMRPSLPPAHQLKSTLYTKSRLQLTRKSNNYRKKHDVFPHLITSFIWWKWAAVVSLNPGLLHTDRGMISMEMQINLCHE